MACKPSNYSKKLIVELEEKDNVVAGLSHDMGKLNRALKVKDQKIDDFKSRTKQDQAKITALEESCQKLRDELAVMTTSRDEVLATNDRLKQHIDTLESSQAATRSELAEKDSLVTNLKVKVDQQRREKEKNAGEEEINAKGSRHREELTEYKNKLGAHTKKSVSFLVKDMESVARYNEELKTMKKTLQKQLEKNETLEQEIMTLKNNHPTPTPREFCLRQSQLQSPKASFRKLSKKWEIAKQFNLITPTSSSVEPLPEGLDANTL